MNSSRRRFVIDTNALVSRLLASESVPGRAVRLASDVGILLFTEDTMEELTVVLSRPKFDRYLSREDRQSFLTQLNAVAEIVTVLAPIQACRDPKDDRFLEAAFYGRAETIVTGDRDLLALDPFRRIRILTPAAFLSRIP